MANPQKHSKNPLIEWLEEEESPASTHSRSARTLSAFVKIAKPPAGKSRRLPPAKPIAKPDPALVREPANEVKPGDRRNQQASFEHQLKLSRLPKLRAPYDYRPAVQPPAPAPAKAPPPVKARAAAAAAAAAKR